MLHVKIHSDSQNSKIHIMHSKVWNKAMKTAVFNYASNNPWSSQQIWASRNHKRNKSN